MLRRAFAPTIVPLLLIALLTCAACGASARTQALRVGLVALNGARDTLLVTSKAREAQIVEHAATKEEGRAQLDAWRATVDKIAVAIEDGYRAIYGAAILNDVKSASAAGAAVTKALALLKGLPATLLGEDLKNPAKPTTPAPTPAPTPAATPAATPTTTPATAPKEAKP